jgi:hypothetical protein
MASKFIKTAAMIGMCFLATTGWSLADSEVQGHVENHLIDGQRMTNNINGNYNKASIAGINLVDSKVRGSGNVTNSVDT